MTPRRKLNDLVRPLKLAGSETEGPLMQIARTSYESPLRSARTSRRGQYLGPANRGTTPPSGSQCAERQATGGEPEDPRPPGKAAG